MGKKRGDNRTVLYGIIIIIMVMLWLYGISHILASLIGLVLVQEVSTTMGFYTLIALSVISTLFNSKE